MFKHKTNLEIEVDEDVRAKIRKKSNGVTSYKKKKHSKTGYKRKQ